MKYLHKRISAFILSVCMLLTLSPCAFAAETWEPADESVQATASVAYNTSGVNFAGVATPRKNKAIVVIPGVLGSQLQNSSGQMVWNFIDRSMQLECNTNGTSKNTITPYTKDGYGAGDIYKKLYERLQNKYQNTYDILFFSYDWRLSNTTSAASLAIAINKNYDEVILVAHSMGGLVASKYLANSSVNRNKVDKLITIGTPYTGAVKLLDVAETGDMGAAVNLFAPKDNLKAIMANFHCTYQLAPTTRYGDNYGAYIKVGTTNKSGSAARSYYSQLPWATVNGNTKTMYDAATTFHSSLIVNGTHIANSSLVDTYKIVGYGIDTFSKILYDANGNYLDCEANNDGDGTVARYSASNTLSCTTANKVYQYEGKHTNLVKNLDVLTKVCEIIDGTATRSANSSEDIEVNEKGWIIGANNKRIYIVLDESADVSILDSNMNSLSVDDYNFLLDCQGNQVGYMTFIGLNRIKYVLYDDSYIVNVNDNENIDYIKIEYQDDGYYEFSASYEQLPSNTVSISLPEYANMNPTVQTVGESSLSASAVSTIITPTNIMDAAQLAERNDY